MECSPLFLFISTFKVKLYVLLLSFYTFISSIPKKRGDEEEPLWATVVASAQDLSTWVKKRQKYLTNLSAIFVHSKWADPDCFSPKLGPKYVVGELVLCPSKSCVRSSSSPALLLLLASWLRRKKKRARSEQAARKPPEAKRGP